MACRKILAEDGIYDASQHLEEVEAALQDFDKHHQRSVDSLDLFSGHGAFHEISVDAGKKCISMDVLNGEHENIVTETGFMNILFVICSLDAWISFILSERETFVEPRTDPM